MEVQIIFSEEAYVDYERLDEQVANNLNSPKKPTYKQLLKSIDLIMKKLKDKPFCGDLIPRKYISKKTIAKYGTDKIFRVELVGFWRLLYTIAGDKKCLKVFILEYMDHKRYNSLLGYRKK
ncbi:hypothetical protein COV93_00105 [Candidatus Woesearchaeota archaeon CG11_big_fil_rev_8_21_14_0_20_43_8]|nr:MAG: hypothetical protein COV93_00105 [Candidatus Woesearchaeota archaeon CG11_big_fil_rev_8_21_14_0_20_43_8]PIO05255.1 MAG: hypothetical protein COT47_05580 [Candidatus Woesearchaeota archaeon CG08_land_8_20_14_0_20_43_7]